MSISPTSRGSFYITGLFSNSDDRILADANIYFVDSGTMNNTEMDSVVLLVKDSSGATQYTLTEQSTPAIDKDTSNLYSVEEIDVSAFPDGDITLEWTGTLDSVDYNLTQTISYNTAPDMVFVNGETDTLPEFTFVLEQAKTLTLKTINSVGVPVDGYAVRLAIADTDTTGTTYYDATNTSTGVYTVSVTLSATTFYASTDRYEIYWVIQLSNNGTWYEVANSRVPVIIYGETCSVQTGPITYSSNESIRRLHPGIDAFLSDVVSNQGEREIRLNTARISASALIEPFIKNSRARYKKNLLEQWEAAEVYRDLLINAHAFAKFGGGDEQLKALDKKIGRIKAALFGPIQTFAIGGRI